MSKIPSKNLLQFEKDLNAFYEIQNIDKSNFCIVGSSVLALLGIRENNDIDIVLNNEFTKNKAYYIYNNIEVVSKGWAKSIGINDEELINNPKYFFKYKDYKVVKPEILFSRYLVNKRKNADKNRLEKYAYQNEEWDWKLVKECYKKAKSKNKSRFGKYLTKIKKAIKNPHKAYIKMTRKTKRQINSYKNHSNSLESQIIKFIDTGTFLSQQYVNKKFSRYDIFVRYLMVKAIIESKTRIEGFNIKKEYEKMQQKRVGRETRSEFIDLIKNFQNNRFNYRYPVPITKEGLILDGAHRTACALYFDVDKIPIKITPSFKKVYYGKEWFINNDFSEDFIALLEKTKHEIFINKGVYYHFILWPPVKDYFSEISNIINHKHKVVYEEHLKINTGFEEFLNQIYEIDDIDKWKVELKKEAMKNYNKEVYIITFEIERPIYRIKSKTDAYLSIEIENLKNEIRKTYKNNIEDYFYDIICHGSDNCEHNRTINSLISKYAYKFDGFILNGGNYTEYK